MTTSLVSPKYQIVIPREIRRKFNVTPGQRVSLIEKDGHLEIRPILKPEQLIGLLSDCAHIPFAREPDRKLP
jgi:AbrB family looped-hinge helix DNA binding protein